MTEIIDLESLAQAMDRREIKPDDSARAIIDAVEATPEAESQGSGEQIGSVAAPDETQFCEICGMLWRAHGVLTQCTRRKA